jgi:hypothetical protein
MNNKAVGVSFLGIATVLFLSRYIIAMLYYGFQQGGQNQGEFDMMMGFVGPLPWGFAAIALGVGIFYLVRGEIRKD